MPADTIAFYIFEGVLISGIAVVTALKWRASQDSRMKSILNATGDAVLWVNKEGKIRYANHGAMEMFGYSSSEFKGMPVDYLIPTDVRGRHAEHRKHYSETPSVRRMGVGRDMPLYGLRKNGRTFRVDVGLSPEGDGVVVVVRDMTAEGGHIFTEQNRA